MKPSFGGRWRIIKTENEIKCRYDVMKKGRLTISRKPSLLLALQRKKPPAMLVRIKCLKQKTSDARIDEGSPTASMQRRSMSCKMT